MAKLVDRSENSNDKVFVVLGPLLYCSNMWCVPGSAVILCLLALYACVRACCGVCGGRCFFSGRLFVLLALLASPSLASRVLSAKSSMMWCRTRPPPPQAEIVSLTPWHHAYDMHACCGVGERFRAPRGRTSLERRFMCHARAASIDAPQHIGMVTHCMGCLYQ